MIDFKYNYSVIIPYYDKYDLFIKAVNSVPDREDIQIIIVDNSKKTLLQAEVPQKRNVLVTYITSDNQKGAGHARNVGLTKVQGKYILFCDADDYYTDNAFETFDKYLEKECDIVFFKSISLKLCDGSLSTRHIIYNDRIDVFFETKDYAPLRYRFEVPWCKLYRAEFIQSGNFVFEETIVCNDALFSMKTGHHANKIEVSEYVVYVVTEGEANTSLVKTKSKENQWIRYKASINKNIFLKEIDHYELRIRLLGHIKAALFNFGPIEAFRYLKYAFSKRVTIF